MFRMRVRAVVAVAGAAVGLASGARAQTTTWQNGAGGAWGATGNWNNGIPNQPTSDAVISLGGSYTVTLDQDYSIHSLDFSATGPTLDLTTHTLTLSGDYNQGANTLLGSITAGAMSINGACTIGDSVLMHVPNFSTHGSLSFNGSAVAEICDTGVHHNGLTCSWLGTGNIVMDRGATFTNGAASTFTISNNQTLSWDGNGTRPTFTNQGILKKVTGTGTTTVTGIDFDNPATLEIDNGTFSIDRVVQLPAATTTLAGGKWLVTNGSTLDFVGGSILTNAGDVTLQDAGSTFAAINGLTTNASGGKFTVSSGRNFQTAGNFTNNGALTIGAATDFRVAPGSQLTNYTGTTLAGGTFSVGGTLRFDNADIHTVNAAVTLTGAGSSILDPLQPVPTQNALRNFDTIGAAGKFAIQSGRNYTTATPSFNVSSTGMLSVGAGTLFQINPGSNFINVSGGTFTGGRFDLQGTLQLPDNSGITSVANRLVLNAPGTHIINLNGTNALANLNTIPATGDLSVTAGNVINVPSMNLTGRLGIGAGPSDQTSVVNVAPGAAFTQNHEGILDFDDGELNATGPLTLNGTVTGNGFINGQPIANGAVSPGHGPGTLSFGGSLTLASAALVQVELGGLDPGSEYDQLSVIGSPTGGGQLFFASGHAGTLSVSLINGFMPSFGQTFEVLSFLSHSGEFAQYQGLDLGNGLSLVPIYSNDHLTLVVVPAPSAAPLLLLVACARRRRR